MMEAPDFDRVARPYRTLEHLTFGRMLERTRTFHLPQLAGCRRALVLGDGDGRFTAELLATHRELQVHAVDLSARMLALLRARAGGTPRLQTTQADARTLPPEAADLVVTHFLLDCLTESEAERLIARHAPAARLWLTSEFHAPAGPLHWPARALIRALYLGFRLLTGLRVTRVPDYRAMLRAAAFAPNNRAFLGGILVTTLWTRIEPTMQTQDKPNEQPDPQPDPEPIAPSLDQPDPGVFHHDPKRPESQPILKP